ncbi:MAG: hypothetical protein QXF90_08050 [Thermofilaceae archaeon]
MELSLAGEANASINSTVKDAPAIRDEGSRARKATYILYESALAVVTVADALTYSYAKALPEDLGLAQGRPYG